MSTKILQAEVCDTSLHLSRNLKPTSHTGISAKTHLHDNIEILAGHSGMLEVCVDGKKINLRVGDVLIVNQRVPHSSSRILPFTAAIQMHLQPEKPSTQGYGRANEYLSVIPSSSERIFVYLKREDSFTAKMFDLIDKMYQENTKREANYELIVSGQMNILLGYLYRQGILENSQDTYNYDTVNKILPCLKYIDENYNKELSLETLSSTLGMNREYFCRLFKKAVGVTPTEYVNFVRVRRAENMLLTTNDDIMDISTEVGFCSVSYFNRVFKNQKNITPSAYREIIYAKDELI